METTGEHLIHARETLVFSEQWLGTISLVTDLNRVKFIKVLIVISVVTISSHRSRQSAINLLI